MADSDSSTPVAPTPQRCLVGAICSGLLAWGCYLLMDSIATKLASTPIPTDQTAHNIAVALRTLLLGSVTLATGVFALVTVGLLALGVQTLFTRQPQ